VSHGWVNLGPYAWNNATEVLSRREYLDSVQDTVVIDASQKTEGEVRLQVMSTRRLPSDATREIVSKMTRALGLDIYLSDAHERARALNPIVADLLANGGGRFLRGTTLFEDAVKTLCTTNASWAFSQSMVSNLIREYGHKGAFPTTKALAAVTERRFRAKARVGYRAKYLVGIVHAFAESSSTTIERDRQLPGLGEYGATHLRMLEGDFAHIPIDSEVRDFCRRQLELISDEQIRHRYQPWGAYAFLGYKLERIASRLNWIGDTGRQ
jgi:N-glycosylase/DNA lyase